MLRHVLLPADLPDLVRLEATLFPHNAMSERSLQQEVDNGLAWAFGNPLRAYALVRVDGPLLDITRLAVDPMWQRQGAGSALLRQVTGLGKETMLSVEKWNDGAFRLYRKFGFTIVASDNTFGLAGAWVMRRAAQKGCETNPVPQPVHW